MVQKKIKIGFLQNSFFDLHDSIFADLCLMREDSEIPENCPGTESENAGKSSACAGCPNQQACLNSPKGPDPEIPLIRKKLEDVKAHILVLSGKGGVGKSTLSTNLAYALASDPSVNVGLLDTDICGPSIPRMTGVVNEGMHVSGSGWSAVNISENLSVMSVGFLLEKQGEAIIWRGDKKNGLIKQFLRDVDWGAPLDYMVIDTPPGSSDEHLTLAKYMDLTKTHAIMITTPQELSLQDVRKQINVCRKVGIPIIGIVENMSQFKCPCCGYVTNIFPPSTGGAEKMCKDMNVNFLGTIPLDMEVTKSCDTGIQYIDYFPDTPGYKAYLDIAEKVITCLS